MRATEKPSAWALGFSALSESMGRHPCAVSTGRARVLFLWFWKVVRFVRFVRL